MPCTTFETKLATLLLSALCLCAADLARADDEAVDATDPTKVYTYFGGGLKYNEYTNSDYMVELRFTGNLGLSDRDTLLFEGGYGWQREALFTDGDDNDWTDFRFRWFHLFDMDYDLERGYRGMGTQVDLQLAGNLQGTDGQNQLAVGVMPAFALNRHWNLYLQTNVVGAWDKNWNNFNGAGPGVNAQFIYSPDHWWPGAQIQIIPQYTKFLTGKLDGEGSGTFEVNIGGQITPTVMWDTTFSKNLGLDLKSLSRDIFEPDLENDWNVFFSLTSYF
jgi:hypothetical protein